MALPSTPYTSTYDIGFAAGSSNKEAVYGVIQNIARFDTPLYSSMPKVTVGLTTYEWLTDALAATATAGAQEGALFAGATRTNRSRKANNVQIFSLGVEVTDTQAAISPFGMQSEYDYECMLTMREVARNIESRAWINTGFERVTASEASAAGRVTASLRSTGSWGAAPTSSVAGVITTAAVENLFEVVAGEGGTPDRLYCSLGVKADLSNAALTSGQNRMYNLAATDKRFVSNITVYEGNFGTLVVVPDIFIPQGSASASAFAAALIDSARVQCAVLRPMKHVPIAKVGDSTRGTIITELGFQVLHASANGFLTDITT